MTSKSDYQKVAKDFTKIRDSISAMDIKDFRYDDATTVYAYVFSLFKKIHLGSALMSASDSENNRKYCILLHEATHKFGVLRTKNHVHGTRELRNWRIQNLVKL